MKFIFFKSYLLLIFVLFACEIDAKRSSSGRTRSKSTGGSWWSRRKSSGSSSSGSSQPSSEPKPVAGSYPKQPSAPVKTQTKKEKAKVQQSKPNQPKLPIGWNIPGQNSQAKSGAKNPGYTARVQNPIRKETSKLQHSSPNQQKSSVGWNIPGQQNNGKTFGLQGQPNPNKKQQQSIGWNIPGQKQSSGPTKGGWISGYKTQNSRAETPIKKDTSKLQQSSPNQPQPPQSGWKSGYQTPGANGAPPAYSPAGHYPHGAAPPAYSGQPTWGAPPAYNGHAPGYGGFGHSYPQQSGGYGGYQQHSGYGQGYGGMGMGGMGMGGMGMGMGQSPMGGGGYGYGNRGFGSFGGGFGGGSYPMQKSGGFGSTVSNVLAGMFVYSMASKLISYGMGSKRPYTVTNYYNQPDQKVEEIKLPSNVLMLCEGNVLQMCGQGMQAVCTSNGTVLCVATMNQASPCDQGGNHALCVNTTVPCTDASDPLCQNSTKIDQLEATVNVPCLTNLTLDVDLIDKSSTQPNTKYTYCVTTMAIAGPEYQICSDLKDTNDYRSVLNGNYDWFLEIDGFRRNYSIYNYEQPMEAEGEIHMPISVLTKCSENATKVCAPNTIATCTTFNEIMCLAALADTTECTEQNNTCITSIVPCPVNNEDKFCENKTEEEDTVTLELSCFANITINAPIPKFNLAEFNGTFDGANFNSSYTYHFNYCVVTLALAGSDFDMCITKEAKESKKY